MSFFWGPDEYNSHCQCIYFNSGHAGRAFNETIFILKKTHQHIHTFLKSVNIPPFFMSDWIQTFYSLFLIIYMSIFPSRDKKSALARVLKVGTQTRPYRTEPEEGGCVLPWQWQSLFATGWAEPGLTVRGVSTCTAGCSRPLGLLNTALHPAEPGTHSSKVRESGYKTRGI